MAKAGLAAVLAAFAANAAVAVTLDAKLPPYEPREKVEGETSVAGNHATHEEVERRLYPLTRTIYLGVNQPAGKPLRPVVREFLRFVLSREGQEAFTEGPEKYLPLTEATASAERRKLD